MSNETELVAAQSSRRRRRFQFSLRMLLILVTFVAAVSGFFRWRWLNSPEAVLARQRAEFTERFKSVPLVIGPWVGKEIGVTPIVLEAYECRGAASREYRNTEAGATIGLFVMRGPTGPTAIQPSLGCAGIQRISLERTCDFGLQPEVESMRVMEMKNRTGERYIDVISFSPAGIWSKPTIPRIAFADENELTQLQLVYSNPTKSSAENWLDLERFIPQLFPHLQQAIFPQSKAVDLDPSPRWPKWLSETSLPLAQLLITSASIVGLIYLNRRRKVA